MIRLLLSAFFCQLHCLISGISQGTKNRPLVTHVSLLGTQIISGPIEKGQKKCHTFRGT